MGGLWAVVVVVVDYSAVSGDAGVVTFAVVLYFFLKLEFYFTAPATAYVMARSPPPPLC